MKNILLGAALFIIVVWSLIIYNGHKEAVAEENAKSEAINHMNEIYPEYEISGIEIVFDWKGNKYDIVFNSINDEQRTLVYNPQSNSIYDSHLNFVVDQYTAQFAVDHNENSEHIKESLKGNYDIVFFYFRLNHSNLHEIYKKYKQDVPFSPPVYLSMHVVSSSPDNVFTKEEFRDFIFEVVESLLNEEDINCTGLQVMYGSGMWDHLYRFSYYDGLENLNHESISNHIQTV